MPFRLSIDHETIVLVEVSGMLSDRELAAMSELVAAHVREQQANGTRAAVVLDFSAAGPIAPNQRKMIGNSLVHLSV